MSTKRVIPSSKEKPAAMSEDSKASKPSTAVTQIDGEKKKTTRGKKLKDVDEPSSLPHHNVLTDSIGSSSSSDEKDESMLRHQREVAQAKKALQHPVSDDTLDDLEAQVDKFNETKHLGEKIKLHSALKDSIQTLEQEVDDMVEIIDKIDIDAVSAELKQTAEVSDRTDITDDIVSLEKMVEGMKEEEIMQIKLMHIQKITEIVKRCKSKCDSSKMRIAKCN